MYNAQSHRHVTIRRNADGTERLYFFRRGMPISRLPDVTSPLFDDAYAGKLAESEGPPNMKTIREAIAWTFGMTEREYQPLIET